MNNKEIILNCLKSVNSLLTDNSGAVVFNPDVYIVEKEMNKFQKFTSLCIDNIRMIGLQYSTLKHNNFYDARGAFASKKQHSVVINLNSFKGDLYEKDIIKPLGEELNLSFITFHECAHLLEDMHWRDGLFKAYNYTENLFVNVMEHVYNQHIGMQEKLAQLPLNKWAKENKKWDTSIEKKISKALYQQVNESWADCFSMMMIYKNLGIDAFEKTISHVMHHREFTRNYNAINSISNSDDGEWLGQTHNTGQALLKLKDKVLQSDFVKPEDLNWDSLKEAINSSVTQAAAFDFYQAYNSNAQISDYFDGITEQLHDDLSNGSDAVIEQTDLFESAHDRPDFYDLCMPFWSDMEIGYFNLGIKISQQLKTLVDRDDFFSTMEKPLEEGEEIYKVWLEDLNIGQELRYYNFCMLTLLQARISYSLITLDSNALNEHLKVEKMKKVIDYQTYQRHLNCDIAAGEGILKDMPQSVLDKFNSTNPTLFNANSQGEQRQSKKAPLISLIDKIKNKAGLFYYISPEKIKIKP